MTASFVTAPDADTAEQMLAAVEKFPFSRKRNPVPGPALLNMAKESRAMMIDAERIVKLFADSDPRMPLLVFSLLAIYLDSGPFEFDATALSNRLPALPLASRINAEELASLQPELERFFEPGGEGWRPRSEIFQTRVGAV